MTAAEEPPTPSSARVLLVEDDSELADGLAAFLCAHGMTVSVAADGTDGLARARAEEYDAAVIDMMLPGASGFAVVQTVRAARGPDVPVVMVSEIDAPEHREYAHLLGVNWFLPKPFTPDELLSDLQTLLAAKS
jgi:DNA-binding response OmpR family regulator